MPAVMGVDSSTQSTKIEIRDADDGTIMARAAFPHPPTTPPRSEQRPDDWWTAFEAAWAATGSLPVDAVSVAAQQHGLVALADDRSVIRPALLWNDTRSAPDAEWLVEALGGPAAWADACGSVPVASLTITKLRWLRRSEPESFARLGHVALPHDWLTSRLCGELVTDRGDASGTGYWSPTQDSWHTALLEVVSPDVDWAPMLPRVLAPTEPAGFWGDAQVGPGTGDNMAAALGIGLHSGDLLVSIGTSGVASTCSEVPTADPTGAVAGFADATGHFLPLACTLNATKVTDAFAHLLGLGREQFDAAAVAEPTGARGLTLLPYLDGERTPNRPDATGLLAGIRSDVTPGQVARAAFEGVVCGILDGIDALVGAGVPVAPDRLVLVGGGSRSRAYRQILADLSGRVVTVPAHQELVATGACVQAAAVLGGTSPLGVAERWGLRDHRELVEPSGHVDAAAVRARYTALRGLGTPGPTG